MGMQMTSLKWARIGVFTGALIVAFVANAQTEALKIGVVNVTRLLEQAPQSQSAMGALQEEFAPRQREIAALQRSLQEQQETYERDGAIMGETERLNLERVIREDQRDMQREQNEYIEDLNIRRNEELGKLQRSMLEEVQRYAREAGYDMVVADVLFYSAAIDITEDVLSGLQAAYTTDDGGS